MVSSILLLHYKPPDQRLLNLIETEGTEWADGSTEQTDTSTVSKL